METVMVKIGNDVRFMDKKQFESLNNNLLAEIVNPIRNLNKVEYKVTVKDLEEHLDKIDWESKTKAQICDEFGLDKKHLKLNKQKLIDIVLKKDFI